MRQLTSIDAQFLALEDGRTTGHDGVGLNVTVFSYQDRVDFGLVADRDQMPDLSLLIKSLREALEQLKDAQPDGRKRTRDRRSLRPAAAVTAAVTNALPYASRPSTAADGNAPTERSGQRSRRRPG